MIYQFLKVLFKISLSVFFKKISIVGQEKLAADGPLILVSNHPNTFMDPLLIAIYTKQRVGFIANGTLFRNPLLARVFAFFHMIPIYRKVDLRLGEKKDNNATFIKCHEYLDTGNTFLIFPEGTSHHELKLREIKTGTARIALSYEVSKQFRSGLKILPISLDYSDAIRFRSVVTMHVETPIETASYKEVHEDNEVKAVKRLTEDIRFRLLKNIPQTENKEEELFLIKAHEFYTTYIENTAALYNDPKKSLRYRNEIAKILNKLAVEDVETYKTLKEKLNNYYLELRKAKLSPEMLKKEFQSKSVVSISGLYLIGLILCLPIYVCGLLFNYIPYILPSVLYKKTGLDISYKAPVQMIVGLLIFPLFYGVYFVLFGMYLSQEIRKQIAFLLVLPILGLCTISYFSYLKRAINLWRFAFTVSEKTKKQLYDSRDAIELLVK